MTKIWETAKNLLTNPLGYDIIKHTQEGVHKKKERKTKL
jgi:hypothetical protein